MGRPRAADAPSRPPSSLGPSPLWVPLPTSLSPVHSTGAFLPLRFLVCLLFVPRVAFQFCSLAEVSPPCIFPPRHAPAPSPRGSLPVPVPRASASRSLLSLLHPPPPLFCLSSTPSTSWKGQLPALTPPLLVTLRHELVLAPSGVLPAALSGMMEGPSRPAPAK